MGGQIHQPLSHPVELRDSLINDAALASDPPFSFSQLLSAHDYSDSGPGFGQVLPSPGPPANPELDHTLVETIPEEDRATLLPIIRMAFPSLKQTMQFAPTVPHNSVPSNPGLPMDVFRQDALQQYQSMAMGGMQDGALQQTTAYERLHHQYMTMVSRQGSMHHQSMPMPGNQDFWQQQQAEGRQPAWDRLSMTMDRKHSKLMQYSSMASAGSRQDVLYPLHSMGVSCKQDGWHNQAMSLASPQGVLSSQIGNGKGNSHSVSQNPSIALQEMQGVNNQVIYLGGKQSKLHHQSMSVVKSTQNGSHCSPMPELMDRHAKSLSTVNGRRDQLHHHSMPIMETVGHHQTIRAYDSKQCVLIPHQSLPVVEPRENELHHQAMHVMQSRQDELHNQCLDMDAMNGGLQHGLVAMRSRQDGFYNQSVPIVPYKQVAVEREMQNILVGREPHFPANDYCGQYNEGMRHCSVIDMQGCKLGGSVVMEGPNPLSSFSNPISSSFGSRTWDPMQANSQLDVHGGELCCHPLSLGSRSGGLEEPRSSKCSENAEQSLYSKAVYSDSSDSSISEFVLERDLSGVNGALGVHHHLKFPESLRRRRSVTKKVVGWVKKRRLTNLLNARMSHKRTCGLPCCTNADFVAKRRKLSADSSRKATCISASQKVQSFPNAKRAIQQIKGSRKLSTTIRKSSAGNQLSNVTEEGINSPLQKALVSALSGSGSHGMSISEALGKLGKQGYPHIFKSKSKSQAVQVKMALVSCPEFEELKSGRFVLRERTAPEKSILDLEGESGAEDGGYENGFSAKTEDDEHLVAANLVTSPSNQLRCPKQEQCHKTDGKQWRCFNQSRPGFLYCERHHQCRGGKPLLSMQRKLSTRIQMLKLKEVNAESSQTVAETCTGQSLQHKEGTLEFVRCRKTDGKLWRCPKQATLGSIYCEHHLQQRLNGRKKGQKHNKVSREIPQVPNRDWTKAIAVPSVKGEVKLATPSKNKHNGVQRLAARVVERSQMTLRARRNRYTETKEEACLMGKPGIVSEGIYGDAHVKKAKMSHSKETDSSKVTWLGALLNDASPKVSVMAVSRGSAMDVPLEKKTHQQLERCRKRDGKQWQCSRLCKPGFVYCDRHVGHRSGHKRRT